VSSWEGEAPAELGAKLLIQSGSPRASPADFSPLPSREQKTTTRLFGNAYRKSLLRNTQFT
jgi:hypothetical protein